jgi:hypothetical protein
MESLDSSSRARISLRGIGSSIARSKSPATGHSLTTTPRNQSLQSRAAQAFPDMMPTYLFASSYGPGGNRQACRYQQTGLAFAFCEGQAHRDASDPALRGFAGSYPRQRSAPRPRAHTNPGGRAHRHSQLPFRALSIAGIRPRCPFRGHRNGTLLRLSVSRRRACRDRVRFPEAAAGRGRRGSAGDPRYPDALPCA